MDIIDMIGPEAYMKMMTDSDDPMRSLNVYLQHIGKFMPTIPDPSRRLPDIRESQALLRMRG